MTARADTVGFWAAKPVLDRGDQQRAITNEAAPAPSAPQCLGPTGVVEKDTNSTSFERRTLSSERETLAQTLLISTIGPNVSPF